MQRFHSPIVEFSLAHPRFILLTILAITLVLTAGMVRVKVDTDPENMLPGSDETRVLNQSIREEFAVTDMPPVEVAESHEAMLEAYRDLLAFFVELDDGLENEESVEAALAALFTDASANEISQRLETALNDLQAIADANNIEVDLPNTGGDISGSDQAPRPGDPPAARTPENTPRLVETEDRDGPNVVESGGRGSQIAIETIQYESTEFGFSFLYQVAPDEFVFREIRVADVELAAIWLLTRREALEGTLSESEGPPGIRIDVRVISPPPASAEDWVRNSSASNFALGSGEVTDATVGGHEAVAYSWSGLYEARSVVVLVDGRVWSFTVTSSGDFSEIEAAFNDLLRSVIFIQQ